VAIPLDGADRRDRADRVERVRRHRLALVDLALGDGEDLPVLVGHGRLDGAQRRRPSGRDRNTDARQQNGVLHRNNR
jgi:hypothetical protein